MTRDIERRTADWVRRHSLFRAGDTVVSALSGGADSVCLLFLLLKLREELGIQVVAAHYNHRLRGEESDRDEAFVSALCRRLDVPLTLGGGDVAAGAEASGRGVEETARDMRYAFLHKTLDQTGADRIATAHNAGDNVETVLLNLVRGAGIRGLAGIPVRRGEIVRPLLHLTRGEIEEYLERIGEGYVEDSTNRDTAYRRNALRQEVLPPLRALNPSLEQTVLRQSEALRQDSLFLDGLAREAFAAARAPGDGPRLPARALLALDPAIAARVAALAVEEAGGRAEAVHVSQVLRLARGENPSAETHVPGGVTVRREYGDLVFLSETAVHPPFAPQVLPQWGTVTLSDGGYRLHIGKVRGKIHGSFNTFLFKTGAICGKITVRPRMAGDTIRPAGRGVTKRVKRLMIEEKIPARSRDRLPVLADERGVIAVCPRWVDERVAAGPGDHTFTITVEDISICTET